MGITNSQTQNCGPRDNISQRYESEAGCIGEASDG